MPNFGYATIAATKAMANGNAANATMVTIPPFENA
jgi:hypothetical protein